jgi:hypothetical protein
MLWLIIGVAVFAALAFILGLWAWGDTFRNPCRRIAKPVLPHSPGAQHPVGATGRHRERAVDDEVISGG